MTLDRRNVLIETVGGAVGAAIALAAFGWPDGAAGAGVGLVGVLAGLVAAFGVVSALDWRTDAAALRGRVRELEEETAGLRTQAKLLDHRTRVAEAREAINAIHMKVYADAFTEAQRTGNFLPLSALLARIEVTQRAQGLDKPIPPPNLSP